MRVEVVGPGCPRCLALKRNTSEAIAELELDAEMEHIHDIGAIAERGVMFTPALIIDGELRVAGRVPSVKEIKILLTHAKP